MKSIPSLSLAAIALASLCSCTWVKPTPLGSTVAVTQASNVRSCQNLREVTVSVTSKVGFYKRDADTVATELTTLARNEAVSDGGDTIVPSSSIENGKQSFNVYKCNKR